MQSSVRSVSIGIALAALCAAGFTIDEVSAQSASAGVIDALAAAPTGTAQRAALYAEAARADVGTLKALLERAAELEDPATKSFAVDVLLTRYAELDPGGAVAAASKIGPSAYQVPLYQAWLRSSPAAALAAIAKLDERQASMIIPGLLAGVEKDQELVDQILAAAPRPVADRYVGSSIFRIAQDSPREALERAQGIADPRIRADTINGVQQRWASRDPRGYLNYVATLDEAARRTAITNVFWNQIASSEPELALERVDLFPAELRGPVTVAAISALAARDPFAAYARTQQMPQGQERRQVVNQIARSFAERDADGALAWARSLQPPDPQVLVAVVTRIGEKDPFRGLDLAATIGSPTDRQQAMHQIIATATMRDSTNSAALLERALSLPNAQDGQSLAQSVLMNWAFKEPARAADWLVANADRVPPGAVNTVASQFAQRDIKEAASYAARMPSGLRGAWLNGVAGRYAQNDPRAALDWIEQFRGSPEYDDAALAVIMPASRADPEAAAKAAESLGREQYRRQAVTQVASGWAQRDPARAAAWVSGIGDPAARQGAVSIVAFMWAQQDPAAAQAFVLSQPAGQARDGALLSLISMSARTTIPDDALLSGLSDDRARLAGVQGAASFISQRDAAAARAFVEAHVTDPAQQERILNFVANFPATIPRGPIVNPVTGGLIVPPGGLPTTVVCGPASAGPCVPGAPILLPRSGGVTRQGDVPPPALSPGQAPPRILNTPPSNLRPPEEVVLH